MTLDDTNLEFSSTWDIDQLIASGEVSVTATPVTLYTAADSTKPPVYEVLFKATSTTRWFQAGVASPDDTNANAFGIFVYLSAGSLIISPDRAGSARYYIWSDRLNQ